MNSLMQLSIVAQSCLGGSDDYSDDSECALEGKRNKLSDFLVKREENDAFTWNGCCSLPYPDHSYAKPPPHKNLTSHHKEPSPATTNSNNSQINNAGTVVPVDNNNLSPVNDSWEGSVTRCICEFQHDDGYMICCDRCSVWQHVDCMGVDRQNIPETYLCELCRPRVVDKHHAIRCQARKRELLMQKADLSDTDTEEDIKSRKMVVRRRKNRQATYHGQAAYRRKSQDLNKSTRSQSFQFTSKNKKQHGTPLKSRAYLPSPTSRLPISPALTPVPMTTGPESATFRLLRPCRNSHTPELKRKLAEYFQGRQGCSNADRGVDMSMYATTADSYHEFSLVSVSMLQISADIKTHGLEANKDIKYEEPVIEYTGRVMLKEQHAFSGSMSHVLHCSIKGSPNIDVCIDSSHHDNQAKFIRRSANPNSQLRHFFDDNNNLRFCIWSTTHILKGSEVTLPLEFENRTRLPSSNFDHMTSDTSHTMQSKRRRRHSTRISESSTMSDAPGEFGSTSLMEEVDTRDGREEQQVVDVTSLNTPPLLFQHQRLRSPVKSGSVASSHQKTKITKERRKSEADHSVHPYGNSRRRKNSNVHSVTSPSEDKSVGNVQNHSNNVGEKAKQYKREDAKIEQARKLSTDGQDKKLTREEKKLEAIMKAFERIDKKNERKIQREERKVGELKSKNHKNIKNAMGRSRRKTISCIDDETLGERKHRKNAFKRINIFHKDASRNNEDNGGYNNDDGGDGGCRGKNEFHTRVEVDENGDDDQHNARDKKGKIKSHDIDIGSSNDNVIETEDNKVMIKNEMNNKIVSHRKTNLTKKLERRSSRLNVDKTKKQKVDVTRNRKSSVTIEVDNNTTKNFKKNTDKNMKGNSKKKKKPYEQESFSEDDEEEDGDDDEGEDNEDESDDDEDGDDDDDASANNDAGDHDGNDADEDKMSSSYHGDCDTKKQEPSKIMSTSTCEVPSSSLSSIVLPQVEHNQGFTKKRWLRQAINESSENNQSAGSELGIATPLKKRRLTVDDESRPSSAINLLTPPPSAAPSLLSPTFLNPPPTSLENATIVTTDHQPVVDAYKDCVQSIEVDNETTSCNRIKIKEEPLQQNDFQDRLSSFLSPSKSSSLSLPRHMISPSFLTLSSSPLFISPATIKTVVSREGEFERGGVVVSPSQYINKSSAPSINTKVSCLIDTLTLLSSSPSRVSTNLILSSISDYHPETEVSTDEIGKMDEQSGSVVTITKVKEGALYSSSSSSSLSTDVACNINDISSSSSSAAAAAALFCSESSVSISSSSCVFLSSSSSLFPLSISSPHASSSSSLLSPISPCCLSPSSCVDNPLRDSKCHSNGCKNVAVGSAGKKKMSLTEYRNRMKSVPSSFLPPTSSNPTSPIYLIAPTTVTLTSVHNSDVPCFIHHSSSPSTGHTQVEEKINISNDALLVAASGHSLKKGGEWDFEETAAEKVLTKSLSLTDRLKFEFGLDAPEEGDVEVSNNVVTESMASPPSSTSPFLSAPSSSSYSTNNHLISSSSSSSSPRPTQQSESIPLSSESHLGTNFSTIRHGNNKERNKYHHRHHPCYGLPWSSTPSSLKSVTSSRCDDDRDGLKYSGRVNRAKPHYESNIPRDSSWFCDSPPRHHPPHHHKRRYSSSGYQYRDRNPVDQRDRNYSRVDHRHAKHTQNNLPFSRSRFQNQ